MNETETQRQLLIRRAQDRVRAHYDRHLQRMVIGCGSYTLPRPFVRQQMREWRDQLLHHLGEEYRRHG